LSSDDLTFISYSVLVLVGRGGASAHDFVRMMRDGRMYHAASPSQYYAEPKRLARLGYLTATKEPGQTRERTVYHLTPKAFDALREWMAGPAEPPRVGGDAVMRMLAADLVGEGPTRASLIAMRAGLAQFDAELKEAETRAAEFPSRSKYLLLNHRLARAVFETYAQWLDDVELELEPA
jgi:DNA-binding PadR family transcriptional regulator